MTVSKPRAAGLAALLVLASLAGPGLGTARAAATEDYPFVGRWNCEVAEFTFSPTVYNNGVDDLPIEEIQEGTDGSYTLLFADGYAITLSGFTGDEMGWFSHESGDNFTCTRIGDAD